MRVDAHITKYAVDNEKDIIQLTVTTARSEYTAGQLVRFGNATLVLDVEFKQPSLYGQPATSDLFTTIDADPLLEEYDVLMTKGDELDTADGARLNQIVETLNAAGWELEGEVWQHSDSRIIARHAELMAVAKATEGEIPDDVNEELQDCVRDLYARGYTLKTGDAGEFIWAKNAA